MKTLIVYYSFEGDTKLIAESMAEEIGADTLSLELEVQIQSKEYMKYYLGEKQVLMKTTPLLQPYKIDLEKYDLIIIGTPIWSGTFAPALRTFLETHKLINKKIGLFYCFTVKAGLIVENFEKELEGNEIVGHIGFKDPLKVDKEKSISKAKEWIKDLLNSCVN